MTTARRRIPKAAIPAVLLLSLTYGVRAQVVEDSIDVGDDYVGSMCYNSRGDVAYGSSQSGDFLFAIDCSSNQVISRVGVYFPRYWAYDPIDNKAYLSHRGRSGECDSVLVLDGATHTQSGSIPLDWANFTLWDPVSNRLYVSCLEENRVSVIDCATDTVIKHIQTSAGPMRMHLNNRHRKLYVQCHDSERLCIVDLETLEVTRNIRVPGCPETGCYSQAVDKYYCGAGVEVVVVDGATDSVLKVIGIGQMGRSLSMVAVDRHSLIMAGCTYAGSDSVCVINANTDSIESMFPGVSVPYGLHWSDATDQVYCASSRWDQVVVIAGNGSRVQGLLQTSEYPFCFAAAPRHRRLYLGHLGSRMVYVIRDTVSGIGESAQEPRPSVDMFRAWPNPFEGTVRLAAGWVDNLVAVAVYSADGRLVRMLEREDMVGSRVSLEWNGRDNGGKEVTAGVYIAVAEGQSLRDGVRMVKMR